MKRALALARRARGLTSPNPMVGAVLTQQATWASAEKALLRINAAGALSPAGLRRLSQDELVNADDRMYEYSLGLGVDAPDSNITSSLRVGQNWLSKEAPGTDDSARVFVAAHVYFTPAGVMDGKATFFLRGGYNTYRYSAVQGDYRESSVTTGVTIQF